MKGDLSKVRQLIVISCVFLGIILASSLAYALLPGDFKPGSEPDGFRGIKWGQDVSTVKELVYVYTDPNLGIDFYARREDELEIEGTPTFILYGFWDNRFLCAGIYAVESNTNWENLKTAVFEKFG